MKLYPRLLTFSIHSRNNRIHKENRMTDIQSYHLIFDDAFRTAKMHEIYL